jgi:hypothetical protein
VSGAAQDGPVAGGAPHLECPFVPSSAGVPSLAGGALIGGGPEPPPFLAHPRTWGPQVAYRVAGVLESRRS